MIREYWVVEIEKVESEQSLIKRSNVIAKNVETNKIVRLEKIRIPEYTQIGDIIRWAEHRYYDVVDGIDGDFVYRY